jgi:hypothetical protein
VRPLFEEDGYLYANSTAVADQYRKLRRTLAMDAARRAAFNSLAAGSYLAISLPSPLEDTLMDTKANKTLPPLKWHFTGSNLSQPDPEKNEYKYGANLSGTLITLYPVTDDSSRLVGLAGMVLDETYFRADVRKWLAGAGLATSGSR